MSPRHDVIVVGAGHNGLACAAYLARAGLRVLVVERREVLGGAAVTEEPVPGFRFDSCAHRTGGLQPTLIRDLGLARHGLELRRPDPPVFVPTRDGAPLLIWTDPARTAGEIRRRSPADAERWSRFGMAARPAVRFLAQVRRMVPPDVPMEASRDLRALLGLLARLRHLGRRELGEVLRLLPMSAAELLDEWFESEPLRGVLAAPAVTGFFQGPRAAGTAYHLLGSLSPGPEVLRPTELVVGGTGRLTAALASAAQASGAEIRTGAEVGQIRTADGSATGVALVDGEEIAARRVVSNADPRRTFLQLVPPEALDPAFVRQVGHIRMRGAGAKVNLGLAELPRFTGAEGEPGLLAGLIRISPGLDHLEMAYDDAKYGGISRSPVLEAVLPSLTDSSLAPPGRHVMSVYVQYAPLDLREGAWDGARRDALGDLVVRTLAEYAPGFERSVLHRQVISPADLEETYGLSGGCAAHGEMALDQLFFMRPVPGWARYRTPVRGLYLCGAGAHPGGGVSAIPGTNAARAVLRDARREG